MNRDELRINRFALPEVLRLLIDCIGEAAAFRLVEWRGGVFLCVPQNVSPDHPLLDVIGHHAFAQLVEWYAGETIMLPKNDAVMRQMKHALVRQLRYEKQMPTWQIALRTGYTYRRVFQILAEDNVPIDSREPVTGDLFEG